ncbi:MAG: FAD-dependent thymidylate synthase [Armatimonadetes bacterium]|nr:FAD-dependent thymidylate synthase [Armatimonadota bacterium]
MRVLLLSHTQQPEKTVAAAIRLCYSSAGIESIRDRMDDAEAARLIEKVLGLGHFSVLEHASFTLGIEGISRACSHQLVRHRLASYSQQSQRYVTMKNLEFFAPPAVAADEHIAERYYSLMAQCRQCYDELLASGIEAEDARYVLPSAAETNIIMTANARSLLNFFELRMCTRAQHEIRELAALMLAEVRKAAPILFANAGPACESRGYCSEGEMTCGRAEPLGHPSDDDQS